MSVLVEKIAKSKSNTGGEISQYPPALIDDVSISTSSNSITINFTWPNDTILGGDTLVQVSNIVCLIKKGDIPMNIEDGYDNIQTITSKSVNSVTFSGLESETKYYIRFYVYGTNGECNDSGEMIYEVTTSKPLSTILGDNDWSTIIEVAESGNAQDYWSVGDEIIVHLSEPYNIDVVLQIWGFNHFNNPRFGHGTTYNDNICFGCKDIYIKDKISSTSTASGWDYADSYICKTTLQKIYNSLPAIIRNAIKPISNLEFRTGNRQYGYVHNQTVFIPTMYLTGTNFEGDIGNYDAFPIFTNDASRIKKYNGTADKWWLMDGERGRILMMTITENGDLFIPTFNMNVSTSYGVVFCFNI